jgi:DNA repair protein RecN (Recombination protein N)
MFKRLQISNYALISSLDIQFGEGLVLITGETGAGKSILLGALQLILGARADLSAALDPSKPFRVEAEFVLSDSLQSILKPTFDEWDLDFFSELIIRREISPSGRSRGFINDTPVPLTYMKELGLHLVDIHSQHDTADLFSATYQMLLIDGFAQNNTLLQDYSTTWHEWKKTSRALDDLLQEQSELEKEAEFFQFQYDEFEGINLDINEDDLKEQVERLENLESTKEALGEVFQLLQGNEINVELMLSEAVGLLQKRTGDSKIEEITERIRGALIELNDAASQIESISDELDIDPEEQQLIIDQYNQIERLKTKHHVSDIEGLVKVRDELESKVASKVSIHSRIKKTETLKTELESQLSDTCKKLADNRAKTIPQLASKVSDRLTGLGMPNAEIDVQLETQETFFNNGNQTVSIDFRANKGHGFKPLQKTASGGELSRLMLVIKSIQAEFTELPTMIFDEIDTGVSGEIAAKMGAMMHRISQNHQLVAITHLPQVAAQNGQHLFVSKTDDGEKTTSRLEELSPEQRITQISRMLGGDSPSEAAMENARVLLRG